MSIIFIVHLYIVKTYNEYYIYPIFRNINLTTQLTVIGDGDGQETCYILTRSHKTDTGSADHTGNVI